MVTEEGVVEKTFNREALVRIQRTSSCEGCSSRGACRVISERDMMVQVANPPGAKAGDRVEIRVPTGSLLKASLLVYVLPVAALLVGAVAGRAWAPSLHIQSTLASILGGCLAMGISFVVLRKFDRAVQAKTEYHPRIMRIVQSKPR